MSRIDLNTLVACFEKRIDALEKNPPDKVPTHVIIKMLEQSVDDEVKAAFIECARNDVRAMVKKEFKEMKNAFIKKTLENILTDESFRKTVEHRIRDFIILNIK
jgi:DNA repair photolyase